MSVFARIAGTDTKGAKIPVWPIMMDITRVMDQEITFAALAEKYELPPAEQAELGEYMTAIGAILASEVATRVGIGWPQASAARDARVSVDAVLRYALLRTEQGTINQAQFRAWLGL